MSLKNRGLQDEALDMGKERRRSPRVRQRAACEVSVVGTSHEGTLLDLSEGGLAVVCGAECSVGDSIGVSFLVGGQSFEVQALVWHSRRVRFRGDLAFAYGMMVEEMPAALRRLLPRPKRATPRAPDKPLCEDAEPSKTPEELRASDEKEAARLEEARSELFDSMEETRSETEGHAYRVRVKLRTEPRTKTLSLSAPNIDEARVAVRESLGAEWEILEIRAA